MMGCYIFVAVFALTIPICFFAPTPLDDLTINLNLDQPSKGYGYEEDVMGEKDTCTTVWLQKNQGVQSKVDKKRKRIIGGTEVVDWEKWPWTASMEIAGENENFRCGGALISCNHIVTALHCLYDKTEDGEIVIEKGVLPAGNVLISLGSTMYMKGKTYLAKLIYYKNTGFVSGLPKEDIAVIEMLGVIKPPVHPILLPTRNVGTIDDSDIKKRSTNFWMTGWGDTPKYTNRLKQINQLKLRPGKICKQNDPFFDETIEICMERFPTADPKAAFCDGDSGSPGMVQYTIDRKWRLQTVASYNDDKTCTKPGFAALTNVFYYKKDIEKIIDNKQPEGWTTKS